MNVMMQEMNRTQKITLLLMSQAVCDIFPAVAMVPIKAEITIAMNDHIKHTHIVL